MWQRTILNTILTVFVCLFAMAGSTAAKTIYVDDDGPADFNSIQAAINDANDRDTIIAADGVYRSDVSSWNDPVANFRGKDITLRSENGPGNCILSGGYYVVCFDSGETPAAVLCGFTITNGDPDAGIGCYDSSPTIVNNIITENWSEYGEGAVLLWNSSAHIIGNIISGNTVYGECAGIVCCGDLSAPRIVNNTIVGNGSPAHGNNGGVYCEGNTSAIISNCIFWDNGDRDLYGCHATYSCLEHEHPGLGNVYANPLFSDPGHWRHGYWVDGDYHLLPGSPCRDVGDNASVAGLLTEDFDGEQRVRNGTVDMGVYESPEPDFILSADSITIPEGKNVTFTVALANEPSGAVEACVYRYWGDSDITVESGAKLTFDSSNYYRPQPVTLAAAEDGDYLDGASIFWISAPDLLTAGVRAAEEENDSICSVLYVDDSAPGKGSGRNWTDAFIDLQEALQNAAAFQDLYIVTEIRVAQGTYRPGPSGYREATFELIQEVSVKGGYAGFGAPDPDARDPRLYETVLSGDLDGNDDGVSDPCDPVNDPTRAENSYHVVAVRNANDTVLDGFTIRGGNACANSRDDCDGGGMYIVNGSTNVLNSTFTRNSALYDGGGIYCERGCLTTVNCRLTLNAALYGGGGCVLEGYRTTMVSCTLSENLAESAGGGICNIGHSSMRLTNCLVSKNSAERGGGVSNDCSASLTLNNCTFSENTATKGTGGGIWAGEWYCSSRPVVTNCILWGNRGGSGESAQIYRGKPVVNYSCIQDLTGDLGGRGNIGADPCFADSNNGDYHLKSQAGRWDASEGRWMTDDVTSPCIDAGDPMSPIGLEPFPNGGVVNMGAYGGAAEASKSYFGKPPCETIVAGDINGDCAVDFKDFVLMALHWLGGG